MSHGFITGPGKGSSKSSISGTYLLFSVVVPNILWYGKSFSAPCYTLSNERRTLAQETIVGRNDHHTAHGWTSLHCPLCVPRARGRITCVCGEVDDMLQPPKSIQTKATHWELGIENWARFSYGQCAGECKKNSNKTRRRSFRWSPPYRVE